MGLHMEVPKQPVVLGSPCGLPGEAIEHAKVRLMTVGLNPITIYAMSGFYTSPSLMATKVGGFTPNQKIKADWP